MTALSEQELAAIAARRIIAIESLDRGQSERARKVLADDIPALLAARDALAAENARLKASAERLAGGCIAINDESVAKMQTLTARVARLEEALQTAFSLYGDGFARDVQALIRAALAPRPEE